MLAAITWPFFQLCSYSVPKKGEHTTMKALFLLPLIWWSGKTAVLTTGSASGLCPECATDEICNTATSTCDCNLSQYNTTGALTVEVYCAPSFMGLILSKCQLEKDMYNSSSLHLIDPTCTGNRSISVNGSLIDIYTTPSNGSCGNLEMSNDTHTVYSNMVTISTYIEGFSQTVSFSCTYDVSGNSNNLYSYITVPMLFTTWSAEVDGFGNFSAQMVLYWDETLTMQVQASELLHVEDNVFIGVEVKDMDESQFSLLVKSMYAAPFPDTSSASRYDLIIEGCPNNIGANVLVKQNGRTKLASFEMSVFKIIGYDSYVLFADLHLCNNTCTPSCLGSTL